MKAEYDIYSKCCFIYVLLFLSLVEQKEEATQTGHEDIINQNDSDGSILKLGYSKYPSIRVDSHCLNNSTDGVSPYVTSTGETLCSSGHSSSNKIVGSARRLARSEEIDHNLFEKRNFLSSSLSTLESQAAIRLATYDKMSPRCWRRSMAV